MVPEPALGLDPGDEARVGQKNGITRRWARRGTRPRAAHDQRTKSAYIFGAICPKHGKSAGLVLPRCNTAAMQLHLDEIARSVDAGAHALLLLDRAGWHMTDRLAVPDNITLMPLPPRAPELNPVENVWQFMRDNWLSNRVFTSYDDILENCCDAWNRLAVQPWRIMSIGMRDWAIGHDHRELVLPTLFARVAFLSGGGAQIVHGARHLPNPFELESLMKIGVGDVPYNRLVAIEIKNSCGLVGRFLLIPIENY